MTVYWRPGCFFCRSLLRGLSKAGVAVTLRNIWEDDEARQFVRRHNRGDETVPTVAVGPQVWTNPSTRTVVEAARRTDPDRAGVPSPGRVRRSLGRT